jgi:hypothetical protein
MNLLHLAEKWEESARRAFVSAERQEDDPSNRPTGKILIEHGVMCYANCARELREALASVSPQSSAIQEEGQK